MAQECPYSVYIISVYYSVGNINPLYACFKVVHLVLVMQLRWFHYCIVPRIFGLMYNGKL